MRLCHQHAPAVLAAISIWAIFAASPADAQWRWGANFGRERDVRYDVLTRGPVHEAFAQVAVEYDVREHLTRVTRPPPPPIDERPPAQSYDDDDAEWIPGYWSYDDERRDYVWISGIWRVPPLGREWVPGYWSLMGGDYVYTPGFWADIDDGDEVEYLPAPPPPVVEAPPPDAPSPGLVWVPGCWYWEGSWTWEVDRYGVRRERGYVWRPGHWIAVRADWIWTPAHYVYTPRGCVFVDSYWDFPVERRGVIFAPVYFERPAYVATRVSYSPTVAISIDLAFGSMFHRSYDCHYYFGDYYDARYVRVGYKPWFERRTYVNVYDPLYVQVRTCRERNDHDWAVRLRSDYEYRRAHVEARPTTVYRASKRTSVTTIERDRDSDRDRDRDRDRDVDRDRSRDRDRRDDRPETRRVELARPLTEGSAASDPSIRVRTLSNERRQEMDQRGREVRNLTEQRRKVEVDQGSSAVTGDKKTTVRRDVKDKTAPPATADKSQRARIERSAASSRSRTAREKPPEQPDDAQAPRPRKIKRAKNP